LLLASNAQVTAKICHVADGATVVSDHTCAGWATGWHENHIFEERSGGCDD
jgi:hypothetical protein